MTKKEAKSVSEEFKRISEMLEIYDQKMVDSGKSFLQIAYEISITLTKHYGNMAKREK